MSARGPRPKPRTFPTRTVGSAAAEPNVDSNSTQTVGQKDPGPSNSIKIRGARTHNLANIDLDVPREKLVVVAGVSGSGKSSLAFDTIHAEGRRRFLATLELSSRRWLGALARPDVDLLEGLPPTIAIDQRSASPSPRGTVATITEIDVYLRVLYARFATPHCTSCGGEVRSWTPEQIVSTIASLAEGKRVLLLAPVGLGRKQSNAETLRAIKTAGLLRVRIDGALLELDEAESRFGASKAKGKTPRIEAVVDRLVVRPGLKARIAQSLTLALQFGAGSVVLSVENDKGGWDDRLMSVNHACPVCGIGFERLEPSSFSFNTPTGACPRCKGLGFEPEFDRERSLPDLSLSLAGGAVAPWNVLKPSQRSRLLNDASLQEFLQRGGVDLQTSLADWPAGLVDLFWNGNADHGFHGLETFLEREYRETKSDILAAELERLRSERSCPECLGERLNKPSRMATLGSQAVSLPGLLQLAAPEARRFLEDPGLTGQDQSLAKSMLDAILGRIAILERVGLSYVSLGRRSDTLSGGELQRVRLASQLGSGVNGACYVLDEPTAGLHPSDTETLLGCLRELRDRGNSLIVVEHDEETMRAADWLIEIGPGAGESGGKVVAAGTLESIIANPQSLTGQYLGRSIESKDSISKDRGVSKQTIAQTPVLRLRGADARNLQQVDVNFPVGKFTCVTGVSGSGKSTLVLEVLAPSVRRFAETGQATPIGCDTIEGAEIFERVVVIDQKPIGRSPRSTPATFSGALDTIRQVFARSKEARLRGFGPSRFSFNSGSGRCETCQGRGFLKSPLAFLPELASVCEQCGGKRFNPQTLAITYKGKSIADVLEMTVDEAIAFFSAIPKAAAALQPLAAAGLGYLALGQSGSELSGGEAQRLKLASQLALGQARPGGSLYILDEPTTGLHFADVATLLDVLSNIVKAGDTLIVIEHNLDVISAADWVIDLGPGGGPDGGAIVAVGTPEALANSGSGATAVALLRHFGRRPK